MTIVGMQTCLQILWQAWVVLMQMLLTLEVFQHQMRCCMLSLLLARIYQCVHYVWCCIHLVHLGDALLSSGKSRIKQRGGPTARGCHLGNCAHAHKIYMHSRGRADGEKAPWAPPGSATVYI